MPKQLITYKFKLKPTKEQEVRLENWLGVCRLIYNLALEVKINAYQTRGVNISRYDLQHQVKDLASEYEWIKDVSAQVRQDPLVRLEKSYKNFFRGSGFPKFAKKGRYNSFTFPQYVKFKNGKIQFIKLGLIGYFKGKREIQGETIKQATISKSLKGWFVSVLIEKEIYHFIPNGNKIGIDIGVSKYAVTSQGEIIENPKIGKQYEKRLKTAHRKIARRKKGSNRRVKAVNELRRLSLKLSNSRKDFLHKLSSKIIYENQVIVVEDLRIANMTKSAKGTIESPGVNVKQKSGLNKSLLDLSAGELFRLLEYKSKWYGREFVKVDPKYTSQTCSNCGHKDKENRKSQSEFECTNCRLEINADYNAAKNILGRAYPTGDISEVTCEPENDLINVT